MSAAALEAALGQAKDGALVFSEALTVRERARLGRAAALGTANGGGIGPHCWSEETGRERLLEMAGRMVGGGQQGLVEKLLAAC